MFHHLDKTGYRSDRRSGVAVDGKHLRRSYDTTTDHGAIHLVSAWASAQSMTLGQLKVAESSNELPAIPQLLELLTLESRMGHRLLYYRSRYTILKTHIPIALP